MLEKFLIGAIIVLVAAVGVVQVSKLGHHEPTVMDQIQGGVYSQSAVDFAVNGLKAELAESSLTDHNSAGLRYLAYLMEQCAENPDLAVKEEVLSLDRQSWPVMDSTFGVPFSEDEQKLLDRIKEASATLAERNLPQSTGP